VHITCKKKEKVRFARLRLQIHLHALDPFQLPYAVRGFWTELLPLAFLGVAKPSGEVIFSNTISKHFSST
jgi:hypothetical protein